MAHKFKKNSTSKKVYLTALLVMLLIILMTALELTNTTHIFHKKKAVSGTIPTTSETIKPPDTTPNSTATSKGESSTTSQSPSSSDVVLVAPWGLFVSTHTRGLSGSASSEMSACNTSPGAGCFIEFKQGDITKKLPVKTADSNGIINWSWDVVTAGLTVGQWQISATSTLNNQIKTSQDTRTLDIQP